MKNLFTLPLVLGLAICSLNAMEAVSPAMQASQRAADQQKLNHLMDRLMDEYIDVRQMHESIKPHNTTHLAPNTKGLKVQKFLTALDQLIEDYGQVREAIEASHDYALQDRLNIELATIGRGINYMNNYTSN